ncbi:MAG TPA: ABC transporter ATP-binding protein [Candidatus Ozemobacteraceae bacterium]|nr:ABC transporter ATP-binding protein [Candidatus Ozemobacteraceae bacterium]
MSQVLRLHECRYAVSGPQGIIEILHIPAFTVNAGERVVLQGPSGSGKTTLLHLLSGLLCPSSGEVEVAGVRVDQMTEIERDAFRARHIGYIFQSFNLLPGLSAIENIQLGMSLSRGKVDPERAHAMLAEVQLSHRLHHRPDQLSIGEQQRVAVARALACEPAVLLADEPTGSLDDVRAKEVKTLLESATTKFGCTLIAVSHDPSVVQRFPRQIDFATLNCSYRQAGVAA